VFDFARADILDFFFDAEVAMAIDLVDAGVGVEVAALWVPALIQVVDHSADPGSTRHPYSQITLSIPPAAVLIYQEGTAGLVFTWTDDLGVTWEAPVTISSRTDVYASAVSDPVTFDIHVVYSRFGDPELGDDIWYRTLTFNGNLLAPAWTVSDEIDVSFGSPAVGYRDAVVSGAEDGKLQVLALRATATTRDWSQFTAQAPWTLQNATETPSALPASGSDKASVLQLGIYSFALTRAGGSLILYRAEGVDWSDTAVVYTAIEQWVADESEGFSLAGDDFDNDDLGLVYIYNTVPFFRKYDVNGTLISGPTQLSILAPTVSADITWDGTYYRVVWIRDNGAGNTTIYWASEVNWLALFLYTADATAEEWDWVNTPTSTLLGAVWPVAWCETANLAGPNHVYAGVVPFVALRSLAEAGAGLDAMILIVAPIVPEAGVGTEAPVIGVLTVEIGAGADVMQLIIPLEDTGTGDDSFYEKLFEMMDAGLGMEGLPDIATIVLEYGWGLEADVIPEIAAYDDVTGFPWDTGYGVDAIPENPAAPGIPNVIVNQAEPGAGTDSLTLVIAPVMPEAGHGVDTYVMTLFLTETGHGADPLGPMLTRPIINTADIGAGVDAYTMLKAVLEAGVGTETYGLAVLAPDTGAGADAYVLTIFLTDSAVGADAAAKAAAAFVLAATRLFVSAKKLRLRVVGPGV